MEEVTKFINDQLIPHWPFIGIMFIFMVIMQVLKTNVFTKTAHQNRKPVWFWWWGRKTLALHPLVAGLILGVLWAEPEPGVDTLPERMAYFAFAGALSVAAYEIIKGFAKKKGYDISLPGVDGSKPPPEPDTTPDKPKNE